MQFKYLFVLLFAFSLTYSGLSQAQNTGDTTKKELYLVTKTDGVEYYGYILKDDGREIEIETKSIGRIFITKSEIQSIKKVDASAINEDGTVKYKDFRTSGPFTTRYYLNTNALPIKKGENYAMIHLYGPEVHFAVSDNFSIGVMSSWIASPIALAAKYSFNSSSNTHFALGTIIGSSGFLNQAQGFGGLHWATITQGDRVSNISFSAGISHISPTFFDGGRYDIGGKYTLSSASLPSSNGGYNGTGEYNRFMATQDQTSLDLRAAIYREYAFLPVCGISGIAPVGKKASFIFDAMVFFNPRQVVSPVKTVAVIENVTYYKYYQADQVTEDVTITENELTIDGYNPTALIMPGMRFNSAYNKAFQVVLAGIIAKDNNGDVYSFPVPMVSWLRQF